MSEPTIIFAGVALFITYTVTILGGAAWLQKQFKELKSEIMADFNKKHESNTTTVKALEELVIRHDVLLNAEFNQAMYRRANGQHKTK